MKNTIDPKAVYSHGLDHCIASLVILVTVVTLEGIKSDGLSLFVGDDFAYCAILSKAAVALLHLLDDTEELAWSDAIPVDSRATAAFCEVFQLHVVEHYTVKSD